MLAQSGENALLNAYFVTRIRILAKISVNNAFVTISEKNAFAMGMSPNENKLSDRR